MMMIDCRVMGHSVRLGIPLRFLIFCSVTQEAQAVLPSSRFSLSSAFRLAHPARDRRQAVFTGVSAMIKNVSRTDDNPYGHLLHRSAAEDSKNSVSPLEETKMRSTDCL